LTKKPDPQIAPDYRDCTDAIHEIHAICDNLRFKATKGGGKTMKAKIFSLVFVLISGLFVGRTVLQAEANLCV